MNQKDFQEIENYAYKRAIENIPEDMEHLKSLAKMISTITAFSIAEYHRKVSANHETAE